MKPSTIKVFKDLFHRKLRTILTIVGIAIGITGLLATSIASSQLSNSFTYSAGSAALPDITFTTQPTSVPLVSLLQKQTNVKLAQAEGLISTRWKVPSGHVSLSIIGVQDFQNMQINKFNLVAGHLPGADEILLEASDTGISGVHIGDFIEVGTPAGEQRLAVSGFVHTQGRASSAFIQTALGYMNENELEKVFHLTGVNYFLIQLHDSTQSYNTVTSLASVVQAQHVLILSSDVGHSDYYSSLLSNLFEVVAVLSVVTILLSVVLLLSTVTTLITEQMSVIGTMKTLGAVRRQIMLHYLSIVALYALIGTVLGFGLGILGGSLLVQYFASLLNLDVSPLMLSPSMILESIIIGIGVPLLATILPIYLGTRITVRETLNSYGLSSNTKAKAGLWRSVSTRIFGAFPQTVQFGVHNLFRKRARTFLTLITLAVAGAAFLTVQTTASSFNTYLHLFNGSYRFDMRVDLSDAQLYSKVQNLLANVHGVARIEPVTQLDVDTKWGSGFLTGLQANTQIYQKNLIKGRWFTDNEQNVVLISDIAASRSGLTVGDRVSFQNLLYSATWHIIGIVKDYGNSGTGNFGALIAPMEELNTFQKFPHGYTQSVMIQSTSSNQSDIDALAARVDDVLGTSDVQASVITAQQDTQQKQNQLQILYALLYVVAIIVAIVGAIELFNALTMNVLERRREIGILRSMGATGGKVAKVFWSESLMLGFSSWLFAIIVGIPTAYGFVLLLISIFAPIPFVLQPVSLVLMLVFILLVASLATIGPVWGAMQMKVAQILYYE